MLVHRLFIDEFSPGYVNEDPVFLHLRQSLRVHDPHGLTRQGKGQNYSFGFLEKLGQPAGSGEELDVFCFLLLSGISVDLHSESLCDSPDDTPDSSESEYSENLLSKNCDLAPLVESTFEGPFLFSKRHMELYHSLGS